MDWSIPEPPFKTITKRSFKKFNHDTFNKDLITVPWSLIDLFDDIYDKVIVFNSLFGAPCSNEDCPSKKRNGPWISRCISLRKEMGKRNNSSDYSTKSRSDSKSSWDDYKHQGNLVLCLQRKAKVEYFEYLISKNTTPFTLW
jgi:hypothetical protein